MMDYRNVDIPPPSSEEKTAAKEAASGLQNIEELLRMFSPKTHPGKTSRSSDDGEPRSTDYAAVAGAAVSRFERVISLLGRNQTRTGHARFRRAPAANPVDLSSSSPNSVLPSETTETPTAEACDYAKVYCPTPIQQVPPPEYNHHHHRYHHRVREPESKTINFSYSPAISRANSFISSLTGGDAVSAFGKPPLLSQSSFKRKCASENGGASGKCGASSSGRCHCRKKKKLRLRRVVMVPAISSKMADIPPDDCSWRKYGQKPIKGSPHPRGYYKCSNVRGCPARKHVEKAVDDPTMLVVTYEGEHNHTLPSNPRAPSTVNILESS